MGHYCHDLDFVVAFFVCLQRCSGEVGRSFLIGSLTHLQCFWFNQLQPQNPALQLACCQIILLIRCGMWALSNSCFSWASLASSVFEKKNHILCPLPACYMRRPSLEPALTAPQPTHLSLCFLQSLLLYISRVILRASTRLHHYTFHWVIQ